MSLPRYIVSSWTENEIASASGSSPAFTRNAIRLSWSDGTDPGRADRSDRETSCSKRNESDNVRVWRGKRSRHVVSEHLDNADTDQQQRHAGRAQGGDLALGQAKPAVAIDEERGDLLAGDGEADGRGGADHRNGGEDGGDIGGAAEGTEPAPPWHPGESGELRLRSIGHDERGQQRQGHGQGGDREADRADDEGRADVMAEQTIDGTLNRQDRTGEKREQDPAELRYRQFARRILLAEHDCRGADEHGDRANDGGGIGWLPRHAEHPECVEAERGEHLAGDEEPDRYDRAKAREQQDSRGDVDRRRNAAGRVPPGHGRQAADGKNGSGGGRHHEQKRTGDDDLDRRGGERAARGLRELRVGPGLHGE